MTNIKVISPQLTDYQKDILYSEKRFTVTEASTKCGKTFSHIYWIFEQSQEKDVQQGWEYWWIAPIYSQAEIAFKRLQRKVAMSGLYQVNLTRLTITTPKGTIITFKSADNPNSLYGENVHAFVFDEYSRAKEEAWFALRTTITFTKAKGKFIGNVVSKNWAWNLARKAEQQKDPDFEYFKITAYQAVAAGILDMEEIEQAKKDLPPRVFKMLYLAEFTELEGALWTWETIEKNRVSEMPELTKVVVAVDPAVTSNAGSDETGIVVAGVGIDGHFYVLGDYSGKYTPSVTAKKIMFAYDTHEANVVVGEVNNGGDFIQEVLNLVGGGVPYKEVHASRGKDVRAEPVAFLYTQGRINHVGHFQELEDQMISWVPDTRGDKKIKSPDRIDALVWAIKYLKGDDDDIPLAFN